MGGQLDELFGFSGSPFAYYLRFIVFCFFLHGDK